ncbi:DUF2384 domain-containing protein [Variovorax sp. J22P168]|uniref:antitoxin Xre/MbcA/ParS toxin-binding domain-containing protein n=1 Tax=Variovorax jilinensis TaxID=3053513 RepID=UPI00257561FF|nr:antitoxin Xre/MbcA/ParS toxin-binding domain-containing protein [Variovorax sp. J22P168]MDM0015863.1 DUF2384 domain-containing protein [Variovorax sp. J22P168]
MSSPTDKDAQVQSRPVQAPYRSSAASRALPPETTAVPGTTPDWAFVAMLPGFRASGGIATDCELAGRLARSASGTLPALARHMARGDLVSFDWNGKLWLPLFQFDQDMHVATGPLAVVGELGGVFDDAWELAHWFVQPHAALRNRTPVQVVSHDVEAAIGAARLDRFIALG